LLGLGGLYGYAGCSYYDPYGQCYGYGW
jgi:hypothetical protein